jgi:predicted HTH domain antitoxin
MQPPARDFGYFGPRHDLRSRPAPRGNQDCHRDVEGWMSTLTIELPVDGLPSRAELPDNFSDEARFLLALKLFEQGRISSGKAGRLSGVTRVEFLLAASRAGVPVVDLSQDDLADEFAD